MTQLLTIKLFTGAPEASSLQWDNEALTAPLLPCFAPGYLSVAQQPLRQTETGPVWRSLPLHHPIDLSKDIQPADGPHTTASTAASSFDTSPPSLPTAANHSFASTTAPPSASPTDALSQFYEHSFALHEAVPSSQLLSPHSSSSSSSAHTSFLSTSSHPSPTPHIPLPPLTPLRALPPASHILALHPQTPTVNLLICILAVPPPRRIHPRRGGPPLLLTEILVADDTRPGFGLNVWLPAAADCAQSPRLRAALGALRPRDVVLARNVALSAFRGVVYGQSLRRDATRLEVMFRSGGGGVYSARELADGGEGEGEGVVGRVRAVRRWVMEFVGGGPTEGDPEEGSKKKSVPDALMLPPDTQ
ncbi:hypothetical protein MMC15_002938 [Xylographa vitiligo]|nr:hypothetical protein [Xylographa vitiligo]